MAVDFEVPRNRKDENEFAQNLEYNNVPIVVPA